MKTHFLAGALCAFFCTPSVFAQCATAVNTGGGNCVPPDAPGMPGYNTSANGDVPTRPTAVWADQWGAIVMDKGTGQAGTSVDRNSKADAVNSAMRDCRVNGSPNCEVLVTYHNQCAALALGKGGSGLSRDPTEDGAKRAAMDVCSESSDSCKIVYSACSTARRVQ